MTQTTENILKERRGKLLLKKSFLLNDEESDDLRWLWDKAYQQGYKKGYENGYEIGIDNLKEGKDELEREAKSFVASKILRIITSELERL